MNFVGVLLCLVKEKNTIQSQSGADCELPVLRSLYFPMNVLASGLARYDSEFITVRSRVQVSAGYLSAVISVTLFTPMCLSPGRITRYRPDGWGVNRHHVMH